MMDSPAKPTKQQKQVAIENSLRLHTDLPRRRSLPKIAARWRYRLPSKNLTAHYNSQLCVSFHLGFAQEFQKCL